MRGHLVAALLGLGGSLAAALLLPLPAGEPLRGTIVLLPLAVAALARLEAVAAARGARLPGWRPLEPALLVVWLLVALARPVLGLAGDGLLAALLLAIAALYLLRRLAGLRPLLGRELPLRPPAHFFWLPLVLYVLLLPWHTGQRPPDGDEPYFLLIAHSLVHDRDLDLADNYARGDSLHFMHRRLEVPPHDLHGPQGEVYSRHSPLLPLLLVPGYLVAGRLGAAASMALLAAALAWMTLRLAARYFPDRPGEALLAWALVAFAPPLLLYSYQIWVEVPAALLLAVGLDRVLARRREEWAGWRPWAEVVAVAALLPLLKVRLALLALPLLALAALRVGRRAVPLAAAAGAIVVAAIGLLLAHDLWRHGDPFRAHHTWRELALHHYPLVDYAKGLAGFFYDAAFGLFPAAPLWLLLVPAALLLAARRQPLLGHLLLLGLPYLVVAAPRVEWYGGWSPPFRYPLALLPLFGLALVPLLRRRRRPGARALVAGLLALTVALGLLWVADPGWSVDFAHGRTHLLDHLGERFGADVARLFPSSVRPRPATWLWPVVTLTVLPLFWWARRPRLRAAPAWGLAGLLLAAAAVPLAAQRLPTRVVELEDAHVVKSGGVVFPALWEPARPRLRGGWMLPQGESATAPVVAGGRRVSLRLELEPVPERPHVAIELEVRAGERLLARWRTSEPRRWLTVELGPFDWPPGALLVLAVAPPPEPGDRSSLVVDRVTFAWER